MGSGCPPATGGGAVVKSSSMTRIPVDSLPMARGFAPGELEAVTALVCRRARDRDDCHDLLGALGLRRLASESAEGEGGASV